MHTHYDNLRVTRNAPPGVIKAAYRALSQEFHPDKNLGRDTTRIMKIINEAYAVLSDPEARARYDASLAGDERQSRVRSSKKHSARSVPRKRPSVSAVQMRLKRLQRSGARMRRKQLHGNVERTRPQSTNVKLKQSLKG